MAAETLTTGAPSGDVRSATAPSRRAFQAGATFNKSSADDHPDAKLLRRAAMPGGSNSLKVQTRLIMPDGTATSPSTVNRSAALLAGLAPRFLSVGQAAAYVGVSADTFLEEVALGWWPAALRRGAKRRRLTWDRLALDAAADRHTGFAALHPHDPPPAAEVARRAAEAAAMQGAQNVPPRQHRRQRRPPQAR